MIAPANAVVEPLAMVIESVDAPVAYEAVTAAWQDDDGTSRADFMHVEFLE